MIISDSSHQQTEATQLLACLCTCWLQAEAIKANKPLVIVGTPGRLAELSRDGTLQSHHTNMLVLDEACTRTQPHHCGLQQ